MTAQIRQNRKALATAGGGPSITLHKTSTSLLTTNPVQWAEAYETPSQTAWSWDSAVDRTGIYILEAGLYLVTCAAIFGSNSTGTYRRVEIGGGWNTGWSYSDISNFVPPVNGQVTGVSAAGVVYLGDAVDGTFVTCIVSHDASGTPTMDAEMSITQLYAGAPTHLT